VLIFNSKIEVCRVAVAYTVVAWAKYGTVFYSVMQMADPDTNDAPRINLLRSTNYGLRLPNLGNTIDQIAELGVQFAICDAAFIPNTITTK